MKQRGFTLIELMIVIAIIAVIAAIAIPGLLSSQRASNERNAATSLKTLTSAEADFRANDRDANKISDYWTGDMKSLYTLSTAAIPGASNLTSDPAIKLIELSLATADADSVTLAAGGENYPLSQFGVTSTKAGYWYNALSIDATLVGAEATYKLDTAGSPAMGSVHNTWRFGFIAWPDSSSAGKYAFIIDENNTIYRSATTTSVRPSGGNPPGVPPTPYDRYPSAANLKSFWSKMD
jgi:prepilin-type N-terminal cleavage/methylation domain-containing protein